MSVKIGFIKQFGADQAAAIEKAAKGHKNGIHDNPGSDSFKWAIAICIGFDCMSNDSYRKYHGITAPWEDLRKWIKDKGELASHDGDVDFLSVFTGTYNEFLGKEAKT